MRKEWASWVNLQLSEIVLTEHLLRVCVGLAVLSCVTGCELGNTCPVPRTNQSQFRRPGPKLKIAPLTVPADRVSVVK